MTSHSRARYLDDSQFFHFTNRIAEGDDPDVALESALSLRSCPKCNARLLAVDTHNLCPNTDCTFDTWGTDV